GRGLPVQVLGQRELLTDRVVSKGARRTVVLAHGYGVDRIAVELDLDAMSERVARLDLISERIVAIAAQVTGPIEPFDRIAIALVERVEQRGNRRSVRLLHFASRQRDFTLTGFPAALHFAESQAFQRRTVVEIRDVLEEPAGSVALAQSTDEAREAVRGMARVRRLDDQLID